jgi:protein-tyrosine-phosphatase
MIDIEVRARRFAALGDENRLRIVDDLAVSDRTPGELARRHGLPSNLLAHHLDVLEGAGLVARTRSAGDGRRRYVKLIVGALPGPPQAPPDPGPMLFVCTHNSARSQLAAALWNRLIDDGAESAGTHPGPQVHPGAVAAAGRVGLDLSRARPRELDPAELAPAQVVTVCDRAREELTTGEAWWHWSIPDPIDDPTPEVFDAVVATITERIRIVSSKGAPWATTNPN